MANLASGLGKLQLMSVLLTWKCWPCFLLEDVALVEFMFLVFLHACQMRVTVGDSGLCCCICMTSSDR